MNYISQLNAFFDIKLSNPLSANAQCLYINLFYMNNKCNWIERFTVSNTMLCALTGIDRRTLDRVRNELIQKGYIEYKKGTGNQAGTYLIVQFDTQNVIQDDMQSGTQMSHNMTTLDKQKHKQNKKESIKKDQEKFIAPSLDEIKKYVLEKQLNVDADKFYNYFTEGNWVDSKGNKVKNWKQKILTWSGYSNNEKKEEPIKNTYHSNNSQYSNLDGFYTNL